MKGLGLGITALLLATLTQVSPGEAKVVASNIQPSVKQAASVNSVAGQQLFNSACEAYLNAQITGDNIESSKMYAKAISEISKACALEPSNSDYLLLGSQVWRAKGGISYAKSYFAKAEAVLKQRLEVNPDDITANLDYAIACYAGDVRFWNNYSKYQKQAEKHAEKVIALCKAELKKKDNSNLVRVMALANLVLDDRDKCQELLAKAKKMDKETKGFFLLKFFGFEDEKIEHKTINVFYNDLFENTVAKRQWLWIADAKNVDKEFLLYYMTDVTRNNDL
ncbi:MAG: hypothetical protein IJX10_06365 [Phascolarctobacterium sp.]|nr:hypothetical protein [Phascolarctobacterium sp.]